MLTKFLDRREAGQLLARKLSDYANRRDVLVLALPRGGVPVAAEVAASLRVPMDVFVVRKLGLPGQPELAMGAIASGGICVINEAVIDALRIPADIIEAVRSEEEDELERRERVYRGNRAPLNVEGKSVIVVDDGVATGSTVLAAVAALRKLNAARVIIATPTIAASTSDQVAHSADEVIAVITSEDFFGVGQWYENFSQTTDAEVREILENFPATASA